MEVLDDKNHENLTPYFSIRNENIAQVISLFEKHNIYYEIEKINPSNTSLGLMPLSKNQLKNTISIFHIYESETTRADEIMSNFNPTQEPTSENYLEQETKQQDPIPEITAGAFVGYFFLFVVIFLILFIVIFALNFRGY
ncbi:MAG: hypothetical protein GY810_04345 [Aureispira sp.]|nr:hypothetical protein [Aureispira sp.]